ncbi:hypothetical protein H0H93_015074, partial [Arthromyces matolae]
MSPHGEQPAAASEGNSAQEISVPSFFGGTARTSSQSAAAKPYRPAFEKGPVADKGVSKGKERETSEQTRDHQEDIIMAQIDDATRDFERGRITKQSEQEEAVSGYLDVLDDIEEHVLQQRHTDRPKETTKGVEGPANTSSTPPTDGSGGQSVTARDRSHSGNGETLNSDDRQIVKTAKRTRRPNSVVDEESDDEQLSDSERPSKRRFDPSRMPWYSGDNIAGRSDNPRCAKNRELLKYYLEFPKRVRNDATTSSAYPLGFPSSELDKLIRGEVADFNAILSSLHHLGAPKESR